MKKGLLIAGGIAVAGVIGFVIYKKFVKSDTTDLAEKKLPELKPTILPPSKTDLVIPKNIQSLRNRVRNIAPIVNQ